MSAVLKVGFFSFAAKNLEAPCSHGLFKGRSWSEESLADLFVLLVDVLAGGTLHTLGDLVELNQQSNLRLGM